MVERKIGFWPVIRMCNGDSIVFEEGMKMVSSACVEGYISQGDGLSCRRGQY